MSPLETDYLTGTGFIMHQFNLSPLETDFCACARAELKDKYNFVSNGDKVHEKKGILMAVTKIWTINTHLNASLDYVKNEKKTKSVVKVSSLSTLADLDKHPGGDLSNGIVISDLNNALSYVSQDYKTDTRHYVSGVNCSDSDALIDFQAVKKIYGKNDGAIAYHCIQSFAPGEVDPDQAHLIGIKLAEELWGEKGYQVLVCTHLDRDHIHNHFVINSVNSITGEKNPCRYHKIISATSDRLVKEYGLSVISDPGMHPLPYTKLSKRMQSAKLTVDAAVAVAHNLNEFINYMNNYGYEVHADPNKMYWTIQHEEWKRPVRIVRLGSGYSNSDILKRIESEVPYVVASDESLSARDQYIVKERLSRINNNWKNTAQYKYFVFMLKMGFNLNDYKVPRTTLSKEEEKQARAVLDAISYMTENHINTLQQVEDRQVIVEQKIAHLRKMQKSLQQKIRRESERGVCSIETRQQLDEINSELSDYRSEDKILKTIKEDSQQTEKSKEINNEKEI